MTSSIDALVAELRAEAEYWNGTDPGLPGILSRAADALLRLDAERKEAEGTFMQVLRERDHFSNLIQEDFKEQDHLKYELAVAKEAAKPSRLGDGADEQIARIARIIERKVGPNSLGDMEGADEAAVEIAALYQPAVGEEDGMSEPETNIIEQWTCEEYREGVSPGAAARQVCRSLGCSEVAPTLKRMLEDMLAEANLASFDRSRILAAFDEAAPEAAARARRESFARFNKILDNLRESEQP